MSMSVHDAPDGHLIITSTDDNLSFPLSARTDMDRVDGAEWEGGLEGYY